MDSDFRNNPEKWIAYRDTVKRGDKRESDIVWLRYKNCELRDRSGNLLLEGIPPEESDGFRIWQQEVAGKKIPDSVLKTEEDRRYAAQIAGEKLQDGVVPDPCRLAENIRRNPVDQSASRSKRLSDGVEEPARPAGIGGGIDEESSSYFLHAARFAGARKTSESSNNKSKSKAVSALEVELDEPLGVAASPPRSASNGRRSGSIAEGHEVHQAATSSTASLAAPAATAEDIARLSAGEGIKMSAEENLHTAADDVDVGPWSSTAHRDEQEGGGEVEQLDFAGSEPDPETSDAVVLQLARTMIKEHLQHKKELVAGWEQRLKKLRDDLKERSESVVRWTGALSVLLATETGGTCEEVAAARKPLEEERAAKKKCQQMQHVYQGRLAKYKSDVDELTQHLLDLDDPARLKDEGFAEDLAIIGVDIPPPKPDNDKRPASTASRKEVDAARPTMTSEEEWLEIAAKFEAVDVVMRDPAGDPLPGASNTVEPVDETQEQQQAKSGAKRKRKKHDSKAKAKKKKLVLECDQEDDLLADEN
eukprot:g8684.t1